MHLEKLNLCVNLVKAEFGQVTVNYPVHIVSQGCIY